MDRDVLLQSQQYFAGHFFVGIDKNHPRQKPLSLKYQYFVGAESMNVQFDNRVRLHLQSVKHSADSVLRQTVCLVKYTVQ